MLNVLIGGVDTTQSQLAHAIRLLAEHPDQWAALRADPSLAAGAVEEALRYEPITPFTARIVVEDMEVRGVAFPAGTVVLVAQLHGQPRRRSRTPDRFDIARTDGGRLTTFGAGIHYCLGANLARAELQEGLAFLAARIDAPRARRRAGLRRRDRHLRARPPADPLQRRLRPSGAASIMPAPGMTAAEVNLRAILRIVLVIVGVVLAPLRDLPAAQADRVDRAGDLHRRRDVGAGEPAGAPHAPRAGDRARLPRPAGRSRSCWR